MLTDMFVPELQFGKLVEDAIAAGLWWIGLMLQYMSQYGFFLY